MSGIGPVIVRPAGEQPSDENGFGSEMSSFGYTVALWLRSGSQVRGAMSGSGLQVLVKFRQQMERYECPKSQGHPRTGHGPQTTVRRIVIDPDEAEQIEVCS